MSFSQKYPTGGNYNYNNIGRIYELKVLLFRVMRIAVLIIIIITISTHVVFLRKWRHFLSRPRKSTHRRVFNWQELHVRVYFGLLIIIWMSCTVNPWNPAKLTKTHKIQRNSLEMVQNTCTTYLKLMLAVGAVYLPQTCKFFVKLCHCNE